MTIQLNAKGTEECCPPFDPEKWDTKSFGWSNKKFIRDKVFTFFYMPVGFGKVMKRMDEKVRKAGATMEDNLCLSDHTSKWNMDVYLAVDREVPGEDSCALSGNFVSKVYEGDFNQTEKWCKDFESYAKTKNLKIDKLYMWYTTCPKCAKKYGKNNVAIIAKVV
jgi:hypothetical protein